MSVADKLTKLTEDITAAYDVIEEKGGILPTHKNTENMADAIDSISGGGADPGFFGCTDGEEEMNYLENIMPELLTIKYKGELV